MENANLNNAEKLPDSFAKKLYPVVINATALVNKKSVSHAFIPAVLKKTQLSKELTANLNAICVSPPSYKPSPAFKANAVTFFT